MAFHVPEHFRVRDGPMRSDPSYGNNGAFQMWSVEAGWNLSIIASDQEGWDHVSVRAIRPSKGNSRIPTWREMCRVKDLFWDDEDVVMQLHPAKTNAVNINPYVLHLWRPHDQTIPLPPVEFV